MVEEWILCPIYVNKSRLRIRCDTGLENFIARSVDKKR